jgi:hypothetical protein
VLVLFALTRAPVSLVAPVRGLVTSASAATLIASL